MEKFKLVFSGKRLPPHSSLTLEKHLSLLPFSKESRDRLSSGKSVVLKHNLDIVSAKKFEKKFESMGLVTQLKLQLSPECLKAGLVDNVGVSMTPVSRSRKSFESEPASDRSVRTLDQEPSAKLDQEPSAKLDQEPSARLDQEPSAVLFLLDKQFTKPFVACKNGSYKILDLENKTRVLLETSNYKFGALLMLALAVLFGLDLQTYVTVALVQYTSVNALATVLSVCFLVSMIFVFPKIMQPLSHTVIDDLDSGRQINLYDEQAFLINRFKMLWHTSDTDENGEIKIGGGAGELWKSDEIIFTWNSKSSIEIDNQGALRNVQEAVLDDSLVGSLMTVYKHFKLIGTYYLKSKQSPSVDWSAQLGSVVLDVSEKPLAIIYTEPRPAYQLIDQNHQDSLLLSAFCIGILKSGIV